MRLQTPILTFFFFLICLKFSFSQNKYDLIYKEKIAAELYNKNDFKKALELYLELDSLNPVKSEYDFPIATSYLQLGKNDKALPYLEKCVHSGKALPSIVYYYTAKALHLSEKLDSAITYYELFKQKLEPVKSKKRQKEQKKIKEEIDREIEMCKYGKELMATPMDIKVKNLGPVINSPYPDYGAIISADENTIVFTSTRPGTTGGMIDPSDGLGLYYEDIYISQKTDSGWSNPENMGPPINTPGNDASLSLSVDGQELLIYRSVKENFISMSSGDLYMSKLKGSTWPEPQKLPSQINSKSWEPSASLSADERVLFFSSNREGGFGGTDIYMVRKLPNGEWAMPFNLGPTINTPFDEDSPFIHPDGKTLYFSSKGHKTMGGFDVFVSTFDKDSNSWSQPENVGYPISTAQDDIHFAWSADGKKIYFSSVRPEGYGDKDIYYALMKKQEANLIVLEGVITDSTNKKPMEAVITVVEKGKEDVIGIFNSNSETGKYLVVLPEGKNYVFSIAAENYLECSEHISVPLMSGFKIIQRDIQLCSKNQ